MKPYLAVKLRNDIARQNPGMNLSYHISNISINGKKRGCSGFVMNEDSGVCVYVNTKKSVYSPLSDKNLYRYARDTKDYSSIQLGGLGRNRWAPDDELAGAILELLLYGATK